LADGPGTGIMTESSLINRNCNPGWSKVINAIAAGGGGIHCVTSHQPMA
jgi:agmatine/peptidylarginine deiminase